MRKKIGIIIAIMVFVCCIFTACNGSAEDSSSQKEQTQTCVLSEMEIVVNVDKTFALQVLGNDLQLDVEWISANANVATVEEGVITGVSPGRTAIMAEIGRQILTCNVTVQFAYENAVYLMLENETETDTGYALRLLKGSSYTLSPALVDGEKVASASFTLTSNDSAISVQGVTLTALSVVKDAQVQISCQYEGKSYAITVYVTVEE